MAFTIFFPKDEFCNEKVLWLEKLSKYKYTPNMKIYEENKKSSPGSFQQLKYEHINENGEVEVGQKTEASLS